MSTIFNDKQIEDLKDRLPSVYRDYVFDDKFTNILFDAYVNVCKFVQDLAVTVKNNTTLDKVELYRSVGMGVIYLRQGLYDVNTVSGKFTAAGKGDWFNPATLLSTKVAFLNSLGLYEELKVQEYELSPVVSLKICKDFTGVLGNYVEFEDFVVEDNKLYVFNELAKKPVNIETRQVLIRDILVNTKKIENRWGELLPTPTENVLARHEYKDFVTSLIGYQPNINNLRKAVQAATLSEDAYLQDKYSRKNIPVHSLRALNDLGPFEFMYSIPADLVTSFLYNPTGSSDYNQLKARTDEIFKFINVLKPAHTNFFLQGSLNHTDAYVITDTRPKFTIGTHFARDVYACSGAGIYDLSVYDNAVYYSSGIEDKLTLTFL